MEHLTLVQYPQGDCGPWIQEKIQALESLEWSGAEEPFPSAPDTYMSSFVLLEGSLAVCHVAVRKSRLRHRGREYSAYGLSEVVTHPDHRRQGLASQLIRRAAHFMAAQEPDISIFTCEEGRVPLYARAGWERAKNVCLVGGTKEKPLRSDAFQLATMIRLFSDRAQAHRADFENTDLVLELGEGRLW